MSGSQSALVGQQAAGGLHAGDVQAVICTLGTGEGLVGEGESKSTIGVRYVTREPGPGLGTGVFGCVMHCHSGGIIPGSLPALPPVPLEPPLPVDPSPPAPPGLTSSGK